MLVRVHKLTIEKLITIANLNKLKTERFHFLLSSMYFDKYVEYIELEDLQALIIDLEETVKNSENDNSYKKYFSEREENWLVYEQDLEIIPIYKDAISLSALRYIIEPQKIPNLCRLYFITIPKTKSTVDLENHNFGYHFHYGKVKSNKIDRTNILFTFDPKYVPIEKRDEDTCMYFEYHADGHNNKHVDVETIGKNKREPIYSVCCRKAQKLGIPNFKQPDKEAEIFYPK